MVHWCGAHFALAARLALCVGLMVLLAGWSTDVRRGPSPPSEAATAPTPPASREVRAVDVTGDATRTVLVLQVSEPIELAVFTLTSPDRVVVDAGELRFALPAMSGAQGRGLVARYRYGALSPGRSRLVIDTLGPVSVSGPALAAAADGTTHISLVLTPLAAAAGAAAPAGPPMGAATQPPPAASQPPAIVRTPAARRDRAGTKVIVIDPGHGGIDAGAVGSLGMPEKDVVLRFGQLLRKKLRASRRYEVLLTREIDVFVPLDERVNFARRHGCDLFVSLHTDSVPPEYAHLNVRGATVYTLPVGAGDRLAKALAEKENRSDAVAGYEQVLDEQPDVANILGDLMRRETSSRTLHAAKALLGGMRKTTAMSKEPHRRAAFRVLRAPDVPSVLIELGYLSNRQDESLLVDGDWQEKVAASIAAAIETYFAQTPDRVPY